jgi:hypothetical protein
MKKTDFQIHVSIYVGIFITWGNFKELFAYSETCVCSRLVDRVPSPSFRNVRWKGSAILFLISGKYYKLIEVWADPSGHAV